MGQRPKNKQTIIYHLKKARSKHENIKEKETPLQLLQSALDKLSPDGFDIGAVAVVDLPKARKLTCDIQERAAEIEAEIYRYGKEQDKIRKK
jgi:hypothetical protein